MSNSNDSTNQNTMNSEKSSDNSAHSPESSNETTPSRSKRWSFIQSDLEKALDTWQELEKASAKLSPEEEQFEKIKTIIGQLKSKIEQF